MAQSFEDECFSDGDLDLLASHTINELETEVLQSTQQKKAETRSAHAQGLQLRGRLNAEKLARESFPRDVVPEASSDYGLDDEDIIDLDLNQYAFSDLPQGPKAGLTTRSAQENDTGIGSPTLEQRRPSASGTRQSVSLASRPAQHTSNVAAASKIYPDQTHNRDPHAANTVEITRAQTTSNVPAPGLQSRIIEVCSYVT